MSLTRYYQEKQSQLTYKPPHQSKDIEILLRNQDGSTQGGVLVIKKSDRASGM